MAGLRTLGQPAAVAAVRALLGSRFPHAVVVTGPAGVGKSTLALDIAAALLCSAEGPAEKPCGDCRACRMVVHGNHPDLHRLAPSGAGGGISIGGRGERGIRDLVSDLALLPVEGGARVAIIEAAHRMSEDAQSALLKTLEEPPTDTTILLCADDEERLLPTIRSRCTRIRLGPLGIRDVEAVLAARGVADAPTAARLARITDGRPGHAIAFALAPAAATIRGEIARSLLDLLGAGLTARLSGIRELAGRSAELGRELDTGAERAATIDAGDVAAVRGRGSRAGAASRGGRRSAGIVEVAAEPAADGPEVPPDAPAARVPAAERRRAALLLIGIWRSVLRDLALAGRGATASIRDVDLLDDLAAVAPTLAPDRAGELLRDLDLAGERLEGNVSPELVLDVLAVRWVASARAA